MLSLLTQTDNYVTNSGGTIKNITIFPTVAVYYAVFIACRLPGVKHELIANCT